MRKILYNTFKESSMKITFLGTGANEEIPAFHCDCTVCELGRRKHNKNRRYNSSLLIEADGEAILIDAPTNLKMQLEKFAPHISYLDAIFITHAHTDHILGLRNISILKPNKGLKLTRQLEVFLPESALERYRKIFNISSDKAYHHFFTTIKEREDFALAGFDVVPVETGHLRKTQQPCLGYVFSYDGKTIAYLLDAPADIEKSTLAFLSKKRIDLLIIDCTFEQITTNDSHGDIDSVIRNTKIINPGKTYISHIGHTNLSHEELKRVFSKENINVSFDGLKINL